MLNERVLELFESDLAAPPYSSIEMFMAEVLESLDLQKVSELIVESNGPDKTKYAMAILAMLEAEITAYYVRNNPSLLDDSQDIDGGLSEEEEHKRADNKDRADALKREQFGTLQNLL